MENNDLGRTPSEPGSCPTGQAATRLDATRCDPLRNTPFRWEARCLSDDPFAGDFGSGEVALSDKMVTNRKGGTCHTCAGECVPGTRNRVLTERGDDGLETFRWCQECCFAMAVYDIRPSIGDHRFQLGQQRRADARKEPTA